jgi:DNA topoisomerase IB
MRLRRADPSAPGITRRRAGKGFTYVAPDGRRIADASTRARIEALVIPPAWQDVWISPWENGHLQATGLDAAGRRQYLYHPEWRIRQDRQKFAEMGRFGRTLPHLRERVRLDLEGGGALTRERVLACAVRLLDTGFFRVGSEDYAVRNETYGLATMRKEHVTVRRDGTMVFKYAAKHGKRQVHGIVDRATLDVVGRLKRRRGGNPELLAYKEGRVWRDVKSADINAYLRDATGEEFSAKDFRTWNATVLAAIAVAVALEVADSRARRKRAIARAVNEVAQYLGNTPTVARASYIDPRVFDAYNVGRTIPPELLAGAQGMPHHDPDVQQAVLDLIDEAPAPEIAARVAA